MLAAPTKTCFFFDKVVDTQACMYNNILFRVSDSKNYEIVRLPRRRRHRVRVRYGCLIWIQYGYYLYIIRSTIGYKANRIGLTKAIVYMYIGTPRGQWNSYITHNTRVYIYIDIIWRKSFRKYPKQYKSPGGSPICHMRPLSQSPRSLVSI